ncbi:murein L,D-transpeptidase family protein [Agaribacterium sp. ZY112]|uniref:L,D-transpeptidase family protein n=1 Tax=Agaribacterium sp. ZY112 TaxID=3233574 RepID=UPI00352324AE
MVWYHSYFKLGAGARGQLRNKVINHRQQAGWTSIASFKVCFNSTPVPAGYNSVTCHEVLLTLSLLISSFVWGEVDLVQVDKSERKMYLYSGGTLVKEYDVAFGENPKGHKTQEGDEKTPEGTYTLDYKKEDSSFYRSIHISYPNEDDKTQARARGVSPGGFIMVHGQRNWLGWLSPITQRYNWTDGCIALTNSEMDEFMDLVKVGTTIQIEW